jgi:hypothetical protein
LKYPLTIQEKHTEAIEPEEDYATFVEDNRKEEISTPNKETAFQNLVSSFSADVVKKNAEPKRKVTKVIYFYSLC